MAGNEKLQLDLAAVAEDGDDANDAMATLEHQTRANRQLNDNDYLMLGQVEMVTDNIKTMRSKVNKILDPKRYSDDDDTPRLFDDDDSRDVRKELAMSKAQIGKLQNQARIAEEIRKKEQEKFRQFEERLRHFKKHHYQVTMEMGLWLRQGSHVGLVFASWRHHVRHAKALREADELRKLAGGLKEAQIARMKKYLEMWQGNTERAAFQDSFTSWARVTADGELH